MLLLSRMSYAAPTCSASGIQINHGFASQGECASIQIPRCSQRLLTPSQTGITTPQRPLRCGSCALGLSFELPEHTEAWVFNGFRVWNIHHGPDRNLLYEPGGQPACSTEYPACSTDYIHGACHVTSHRVQSYVIGGRFRGCTAAQTQGSPAGCL